MVKPMRRVTKTVAALILATVSVGASAFYPNFPPPGYVARYPHARVQPNPPLPQGGYPYYALPRPMQPYPRFAPRPQIDATARAAAVPQTGRQELATTVAVPTMKPPDTVADDKQATSDEVDAGIDADSLAGTGTAQFIESLLPLIETENQRILALRQDLLELSARLESGKPLGKAQRERLTQLARTYRVEGNPLKDGDVRAALISKVDSVPASLALAQAANESAWGKSRFAREGNNLFGIWTYDEDKGIVPRRRAPGKKHLVRKFDSIGDSVRYYLHTLNSHPAYASLREIRAEMRASGQAPDALMLAAGLTKYSARGEQYVELIRDMIRRFDLAVYDAAVADSA